MTEEDESLLTVGKGRRVSPSMAPEGQNDSDGSLVIVEVIKRGCDRSRLQRCGCGWKGAETMYAPGSRRGSPAIVLMSFHGKCRASSLVAVLFRCLCLLVCTSYHGDGLGGRLGIFVTAV